MGKKLPTRTVDLTVRCIVPEHWPDGKVIRLLDRVIRAGEEEASDAPPDWDDPDIEHLSQVEFKKPRVNHEAKPTPRP